MTVSLNTAAGWCVLGAVDPKSLVDSRLQLHHAAQIIVSAAISYLPRKDDDSHTNLEWLPDLRALATNMLQAQSRYRLAVRPEDLTLLSLSGGRARSEFPLDGRRLGDALRWMSAELAIDQLAPERLTTKKHYEIPPHPVAAGAPYRIGPRKDFVELSHAYHDAWLATSAVRSRTPGASDPRCWPHHFDLATLITLPSAKGGTTPTIGFGMSPGDDSYAEPYFYVTPSPQPPADGLGALPVGHWNTKQWVGAVLTETELAASAKDADQLERVNAYVDTAIVECRRVVS
jgi:hypothetical protein